MKGPTKEIKVAASTDGPVRDGTVPISEMFESIQGEGRFAGVHSFFIRTAGCNLDCSWCDTTYALNVEAAEALSVEEIVGRVIESEAKHVVVTGGEPLLHREAMEKLVNGLSGVQIEFETNGTIRPANDRACYSVSPKPASAVSHPEKTIRLDVLREFLNFDSTFKFVVGTEQDWQDTMKTIREAGIPNELVYVMPRGRNDDELRSTARKFMPRILDHKFNFSPRLQVWLWGDERGR